MGIIIVVVCICIAVLSALRERNIYNPATLFFGFWAFISGLSALRQYDLYPICDRTYGFILLGLAGFLSGYLIVLFIRPVKRIRLAPEGITHRYEFNYKVLFILYAVLIAYLGFSAIQVIGSMMQGSSMADIRREFFESKSSIISFIHNYIIDVAVYIALAVSMVNPFIGKYKKLMLSLTLVIVVVFAIHSGGRLIFYRFAIDVVIACLIFMAIGGKYARTIRRAGYVFAGILVAAVVGMVVITLLRNSSVKTFYVYFAGCFNLLDTRLFAIDMHNQVTNGYATFGGLLRPIFLLLDNLGILQYPPSYLNAYAILREQVEPFYPIGANVYYNAYVTPFLYYYLDFRVPGIVLGSALYGAICGLAYKSLLRRPDIRSIAIYILIAQEIFTTMIRWQFTVPSYVLALAVLLLGYGVFKKVKTSASASGDSHNETGPIDSP